MGPWDGVPIRSAFARGGGAVSDWARVEGEGDRAEGVDVAGLGDGGGGAKAVDPDKSGCEFKTRDAAAGPRLASAHRSGPCRSSLSRALCLFRGSGEVRSDH